MKRPPIALISRPRLAAGFILAVRLALGVVFVYSGFVKIIRPYDFLAGVYAYELTGPAVGLAVAVVLPWFELLLGLALLAGLFPPAALLGAVALGGLFLFVQGSAVWNDLKINCGCFGTDAEHIVGQTTLLRTFGITLAAAGAFWLAFRRPAPPAAASAAPPQAPDARDAVTRADRP
ncbi:MAG: DoxX family membrane protein [bacterium]|nr:DoxX family membrane protein [bacterium]